MFSEKYDPAKYPREKDTVRKLESAGSAEFQAGSEYSPMCRWHTHQRFPHSLNTRHLQSISLIYFYIVWLLALFPTL